MSIDLHNSKAWTRRQFLHTGLMMTSATLTIPMFLQRSASAMSLQAAGRRSVPGVPDERVLVVIQLGGGNDGLNTVVPFGDANYYRARPGIAIPERQVLRLGSDHAVGLHPTMTGLKDLYDSGLLSVVQGVGYPNPNRSHFASMDIWQTANTSGVGDGWLGRFFDNQCSGSPAADARTQNGQCGEIGIALGREAPLAMQGRQIKPIAFESPELFRWVGSDLHASLGSSYDELTGISAHREGHAPQASGHHAGSNAEFLTRTSLDAQVASEKIRAAVAKGTGANYPNTGLGRQLAMISAMIHAGLETRVYYATLGGFDTHAGQGGAQGQHANLVRQFSDAIKAFYDDLGATGHDQRVLTMSFSEFGRRVSQNGSNGTDHGTAAPMFLAGPMVRPGLLGDHPSLSDLDNGDLKFNLDFRSVYAGLLQDWLKADDRQILRGSFRPARVVASK